MGAVVGHRLGYLAPKVGPMVKVLKMAELVDNEIVLQLLREKEDLVVDVDVALAAGRAPAAFGVFNKYFFILMLIKGVEVRQSRVHQ